MYQVLLSSDWGGGGGGRAEDKLAQFYQQGIYSGYSPLIIFIILLTKAFLLVESQNIFALEYWLP